MITDAPWFNDFDKHIVSGFSTESIPLFTADQATPADVTAVSAVPEFIIACRAVMQWANNAPIGLTMNPYALPFVTLAAIALNKAGIPSK
jgi:hypothetical protein